MQAELILFLCLMLLMIIIAAAAYYLLIQAVFGVPFVPSSARKFKLLVKDIGLEPDGKRFIDIGSGDGRIAFAAASLGFDAVGIDTNPFLVMYSNAAKLVTKSSPKFIRGNMLKHDLSEYNVVYAYLLPKALNLIHKQMSEQAQPGTILISRTFTIDGVEPHQQIEKDYYIYKY